MNRLAIHTGFANCYYLQNLHAPTERALVRVVHQPALPSQGGKASAGGIPNRSYPRPKPNEPISLDTCSFAAGNVKRSSGKGVAVAYRVYGKI